MQTIPLGFVAYPSQPPLVAETIREAVEKINGSKLVHLNTWETLRVGGKVLIDAICTEIDKSNLFVADLAQLNLNVLYELGYAIARDKRIWLLLDETVETNKKEFEEFRLLTTIGYRSSLNSELIVSRFWTDSPHTDLSKTLLRDEIQSNLGPEGDASILYLKPRHATNATNSVLRRLKDSQLSLTIDDPDEAPTQTLAWYGLSVWTSRAVVCQFEGPHRTGAPSRNARMALVAGLAHGLGKTVLLLAEGDYLAPIDYRDRLKTYQTASAAENHLRLWLDEVEAAWHTAQETKAKTRTPQTARLRLVTELKNLQLGDYIAENEENALRDAYFVETAAFLEALRGNAPSFLFVGPKGAGKSANFVKLEATLTADSRNVVCCIRPAFYELASLISVLKRFVERDRKTHIIEGLWRLLLYTELAEALRASISRLPPQALTTPQTQFLDFCERHRHLIENDFAVRLERAITDLSSAATLLSEPSLSTERFRELTGSHLHSSVLPEMRNALRTALPRQGTVAILVDNLDKSWERESDLSELAEFLLGALRAANKLANELQDGSASSQRKTRSRIIVFLRADIYDRIRRVAREPDKLHVNWLEWTDTRLLLRVIEERFIASQGDDCEPDEIWAQFFCPQIDGLSSPEFLVNHSLPKPRDLLFITKCAVTEAINRGHGRVEAEDLLSAAKRYSEFAFEVLRIEDGSSDLPIADSLIELAGGAATLSETELMAAIRQGNKDFSAVPDETLIEGIRRLVLLGFLEVEVREGAFRRAERKLELDKLFTMARKLAAERGSAPRYRIHKAFHPYLELSDSSDGS